MSKKFLSAAAAVLVVSGLVFFPPDSSCAEISPPILGYLRVENPDRTIRGLEEFLQGLDVPPMAGAVLKMGLGGMIENPSLSGVDLSAPLILVSFPPDQSDAWAASFSLPAPEPYHRALAKSWKVKSRDEDSGIVVYTREIQEFDSEAFQVATVDERVDVDSFYRTVEKTLAVASAGKRAWISLDPEILKQVATLSPSDFPVPVSGELAAGLRIQPVLEVVRESLPANIMFTSPPAAGADTPPFGEEATRAMLQAYLDFYLHYASQAENLFFGITLDGTGARMEEVIEARPGTGLANFLAVQKREKLSLARYLEPSPWLAAAGRIDEPQMLLEMYARLYSVFEGMLEVQAGEANQEAAGRLSAVFNNYIALMEEYLTECAGDEMAFSVSSSPQVFITGVSIQKIRSREAYRDYIRKSFLSHREVLKEFYEGLGITVDDSGIESPEVFQGVEIYTARMTFDFERLFQGGQLSEEQKKILLPMEAPLVLQFAASGDLAVSEMSWGGQPDIRKRLEMIAAGKGSFDTGQLGASWSESNGVIYFSLSRYLNDLLEPMVKRSGLDEGEGGDSSAEVFRALGKLDLPLVVYLTVDDLKLKAALEIPMEKIRAVKTTIEDIRAKEEAGAAETEEE